MATKLTKTVQKQPTLLQMLVACAIFSLLVVALLAVR
jgi:type II secretory pathway component PulJ